MTSDQRLEKQQRIEENRRCRSQTETPIRSTMWLTEKDSKQLEEIERVYRSVWQTHPSPASVFSFEKTPDIQSAFIHTMNMENFIAIRVIQFLRSIEDFTSLDERDRLTLVKYNLSSVSFLEGLLTFNFQGTGCHLDTPVDEISSHEQAFTDYCVNLYTTCYGQDGMNHFLSILDILTDVFDKDGRLVLLMMLVGIFLKGWSINEDQAPLLVDVKAVFAAQSKFTDLFFRSLLEKFSHPCAIRKMMCIVTQLLKIQKLSLDYDPFVRSLAERIYVNPLMKSLLHLS